MGIASYLAGVVVDKALGKAFDFAEKKWGEHKIKQAEREKMLKEEAEANADAERIRHKLYRFGSRHQRVRSPEATGERIPPEDGATSDSSSGG